MAQLNFDATQVAPDTGIDTIPAGWYNALIDESDIKPTKDGAGSYLQLRFNVMDGQYQNRKVFARLNIVNSNAQTVEIAHKQLSAIAHAVGILHVQDSQQLHGIPLKIKVTIRTDKTGEYEPSNDIRGFKNINDTVEGAGGHTGPAQGGFAPPAGGFAPPPQAGGWAPPQGQPPMQQPAQQQPPAGFAPPPTQPAQQPAQQPWGQQPPAQHQPPAQQPQQPQQTPQGYGAPQQPATDPAQTWAPPAGQQPWGQPGGQPQQQQPAGYGAPQGQPPAQPQQHPAQSMSPPWGQPQG